jgi:pilus assembly protein CpaC
MRNTILLLAAVLLEAQSGGLGVQAAEELALTVGQSLVVDYAADVGRISTNNPEVVDAVAVSTREVLLNAKTTGAATIIIWSKGGLRTIYSVAVEPNLEPVRQLLKRTFPDCGIQVQAARDAVSLTGAVPSQTIADRAAALLAPFAKVVVNNLRVVSADAGKQILLRVKFAELDRTASTAFGVNILSLGGGNTIGLTGTGQFQSATPTTLTSTPGQGVTSAFSISDALNVFAFRPDLNLGAFIQALQSEGVLQILAEPNLVATNGKDASFLAGGEFPVPVVQGGVNAGAVTIVFKEYGIRLTFLPSITERGTIHMHVKPEVSTIDLTNAVEYNGFTIPALETRRVETDIELGAGQSFAVAGLIDDRVTANFSKIPGLAQIPILGTLFKSRQDQKSKTELIVMVTPEITAPVNRADTQPLKPMPEKFLAPYLINPGGDAGKAFDPPKPSRPK